MPKKQIITVCCQPTYHCELNPIEMVQSQIKRYVADHNVDFSMKSMEDLT